MQLNNQFASLIICRMRSRWGSSESCSVLYLYKSVCTCLCLSLRHRVSVFVVGSPLQIDRVANPTEDQIDEVHQKYVDHLVSLFEAHKSTYGVSQEQHLNFV